MPALAFVVPGRLDTRTGGYTYDRRIIEGLRARGWDVDLHEISDSFPFPDDRARAQLAAVLAGIPSGRLVAIDGLAYGAAPEVVRHEAGRLRLIALLHHPLALETGLPEESRAALDASERRALAMARLVVTTSAATGESMRSMGVSSDRIAVVEPGTDRVPLASGSGGELVHLLSVGAVVPRKGHGTLVEALAAIPNRRWALTCVGSLERDPRTVARLRHQIRACGLEPFVQLVGEIDDVALARSYDASDVFVLPAFHEGYGMAVAEALARGLPVIGTPTGGMTSLVGDTAGILVPPGDSAALAGALASVLRDRELRARLAEGARRVRERLPTWDTATEMMEAVLTRGATDE